MKSVKEIGGVDVWSMDTDLFPMLGSVETKLVYLLRYATLAPSAMNVQPWLFFVDEERIHFYVNRDRTLGRADPDDRNMLLSCGFVIYYLEVAMKHFGYQGDFRLFESDPTGDLIATIGLGEEYQSTPVDVERFNALMNCHSNKTRADEGKLIPFDLLTEMNNEVSSVSASCWMEVLAGPAAKQALASIIVTANRVVTKDKELHHDASEFARNRKGLETKFDGVEVHNAGDYYKSTFEYKKGEAENERDIAKGAPLMLIFGTVSDEWHQIVLCGLAVAKVILLAHSHGINHSYLNQALLYSQLRRDVAALVEGIDSTQLDPEAADPLASCYPQVILRLGFAGVDESLPSPRRPVSEMLLKEPPLYAAAP